MKWNLCRLMIATLALSGFSIAEAQVAPPTDAKTLGATIGVYVFPARGQTAQVQAGDEARCYDWAANNTKSDPFEATARAQQQQYQAEQQKQQISDSRKGSGAKGALAGAAGGALMGEIINDQPGEGAAIGAAIGGIAARRQAKRKKKNEKAQVDSYTQQVQTSSAQQIDAFKKAFSVCLEANGYLVKS